MAKISLQVIEYTHRTQRDHHVARLQAEGFVVHHDSRDEVVLAATQPFATEQWMAVFYGMIVFVVPAVVYVVWWYSKPLPVVIVRMAR